MEGTLYARFLAGGSRRGNSSADGPWRFGGRRAAHQGQCRAPSTADCRAARFGQEGSFRYKRCGGPLAPLPAPPAPPPPTRRKRRHASEAAEEEVEEEALVAEEVLEVEVLEVHAARKHWHCSGRGAALCRLAARRRVGATPRHRTRLPSTTARAFTCFLPLFTATLVTDACGESTWNGQCEALEASARLFTCDVGVGSFGVTGGACSRGRCACAPCRSPFPLSLPCARACVCVRLCARGAVAGTLCSLARSSAEMSGRFASLRNRSANKPALRRSASLR